MSSFIRLPDEVLSLVYSHFDRKQDKQTIATLRKTCQKTYFHVDPLVYCTVTDSISQHRANEGRGEVGSLQRRAWRLARRPDLARFIKEIRLEEWDFLGQHRGILLPVSEREHIPKDMPVQYPAAVRMTNLPEDIKKTLQERLHEETPAAHLAFLLALCTNLEVLEIRQGSEAFDRFLTAVILHGCTNTRHHDADTTIAHTNTPYQPELTQAPEHMFACIREIHLGRSCQLTGLPDVLPMLSLPDLRLLSIRDLADNRNYNDHTLPPLDKPLTSNSRNIDTPLDLVFDMCILSGPGLGRLLTSCASPRSLTARWRPGLWNEHLTNAAIGDAIREFGGDLKNLHLDTTDLYKHRYGEIAPGFGDFSGSRNLRVLAIPGSAFGEGWGGADGNDGVIAEVEAITAILPPSLEELYVLGVDHKENAVVEELVRGVHLEANADANANAKTLPKLRKAVGLPWEQYIIEEHFGDVEVHCVDYDSLESEGCGGLVGMTRLKNMSRS